MPREIFADEIERFLESLDGVSSARVLTGTNGDVSYVYVTTEAARDSRGLRSGVIAALQSRFGLPVDDWRVRVTQLRAGAHSAQIPHFRVVRVEETATASELSVTVRLAWTRGPEERSAAGQAQARFGAARGGAAAPAEGRLSGPATRARTLAAATVAAARAAVDAPHGDLALDRVGVVAFLDRPVVLVAVSAAVAGETETFVGAAFDDDADGGAVEPAVSAAVDAVTRWLLRAALTADTVRSRRRRERLDAMRRFVADAAAEPRPAPLPEALPAGEPRAEAAAGSVVHAAAVQELPPFRPAVAHNGHHHAAFPPVEPSAAVGAEPAVKAAVRGGTAMGLHHETPDAGSGMRARPAGVEEGFYRSLVVERTPVHLRCRDGYEVARAVLRDVGTYALLVETADGLELFFKHAIISIRILPKPAAQA
jgi:sRNA-binding regulator protein Hfq